MNRELQYGYDYFWGNDTDDASDFDSNLQPAEDVSVDAVLTTFYYNILVFAFLMAFYECLRRLLPAVYSSKKRMQFARPGHDEDDEDDLDDQQSQYRRTEFLNNAASSLGDQPYLQCRVPEATEEENTPEGPDYSGFRKDNHESLSSLPDNRFFDWIAPVFGVSWDQVRKQAGLDGYFFLRYIRMCVRITTVSTFWFFLILVPGTLRHGWIGQHPLSFSCTFVLTKFLRQCITREAIQSILPRGGIICQLRIFRPLVGACGCQCFSPIFSPRLSSLS